MHVIRRLNAALPSASMLVAVLALVIAAAGAGYAAGKIGTNQIKDAAVTTPKIKNKAVTGRKVKNGSLTVADLVKDRKFKYVGKPGNPPFNNGGEGDCLWFDAAADEGLPLQKVGYHRDRFGTVRLSGVLGVEDGPGGDAVCGGAANETVEDLVAFRLPAAYRPAANIYRPSDGGLMIIAGSTGFTVEGITLPAGAVVFSTGATSVFFLDEITFFAAGTGIVSAGDVAPRSKRLSPGARRLLGGLLESH